MLGGYSPLVLRSARRRRLSWASSRFGWLLRIITQRGLNGFVYYCLAAAALTFAWQGYEFLAAR